ncbi:hypothetical protein CP966_07815 [Streptomyces galilaeus]|nr:hypothetical protein CP966_07815 [Streptomyces galilaeus]
MIHHLCEISSYRGVSYIDFAADPFVDRGRPSCVPDLVLRGRTRSAVRTPVTGMTCSACGDALLSSKPCRTDLAEWVAIRARRGDHEGTRAHFP